MFEYKCTTNRLSVLIFFKPSVYRVAISLHPFRSTTHPYHAYACMINAFADGELTTFHVVQGMAKMEIEPQYKPRDTIMKILVISMFSANNGYDSFLQISDLHLENMTSTMPFNNY